MKIPARSHCSLAVDFLQIKHGKAETPVAGPNVFAFMCDDGLNSTQNQTTPVLDFYIYTYGKNDLSDCFGSHSLTNHKKKKTQTQSGDVRLCCLSFFLSFFSQFCHCLQSVHELYVEQKRLINCLFHTAEDTSFLTPWTDCRIICVKMWGFEKLCSELIASGNIRCRRMLDKYFVMEVCSSLHTRRGHSQTTEVFSPSLFLGWFLTFVNACSQK